MSRPGAWNNHYKYVRELKGKHEHDEERSGGYERGQNGLPKAEKYNIDSKKLKR